MSFQDVFTRHSFELIKYSVCTILTVMIKAKALILSYALPPPEDSWMHMYTCTQIYKHIYSTINNVYIYIVMYVNIASYMFFSYFGLGTCPLICNLKLNLLYTPNELGCGGLVISHRVHYVIRAFIAVFKERWCKYPRHITYQP